MAADSSGVLGVDFDVVGTGVKRTRKQTLRGRLGDAKDDGFAKQVVRQEKVETVQVPYSELKSIKVKQSSGKGDSVSTAVAWALVGAASLFVALWLNAIFGVTEVGSPGRGTTVVAREGKRYGGV